MATENPTWGYTRIQGALKNVGHQVGRSTIARILKAAGIPPSRQRPMSWRTFVRAHWPALVAADFFATEVWTARGLVTYYTAFVIELQTRRVARSIQHRIQTAPSSSKPSAVSSVRPMMRILLHDRCLVSPASEWCGAPGPVRQPGVAVLLIPLSPLVERLPGDRRNAGRCARRCRHPRPPGAP